MKRVVILQEYVPTYRQAFFEALIRVGKENNVLVEVCAGQPSGKQSQRNDIASAKFVTPLSQRELTVGGRRLVLRKTAHLLRGADLIILEQARRNIDAYRLLGRHAKRTPVALWGHGRDFVKKPTFVENILQKYLTKRSDWFFAYTELGAAAVHALGFPRERITVVKNTVDTKDMRDVAARTSEKEIASFQANFGLTSNVAIFVGGLDDSKRISFLLEAAASAYAIDNTFRLLVVGDGPERGAVEHAAQNTQSVVYAGTLFGKQKILALLAAKVIAMPGRVGLIAVDSFATGRPIVTTNWPWHAPEFEYLTPEFNSIVTDDHNFAVGLLSLMNDNVKLKEMQKNCLLDSDEYTTDAMADRFFSGIAQALDDGFSN